MREPKKSEKSTILLLNYVGRLLTAINTFYVLPSVLHLETSGLYTGIHHMVFLLARMDLGQSVIRYGAKLQEDNQAKKAFVGWVWFISTLLYLFLITLAWRSKSHLVDYFARKSPEVIDYFPLIALLGYVVLMNVTLKAWYIALGDVRWPSLGQHLGINLLLLGSLGLYGQGWCSFSQLIYLSALPYLLHLVGLLVDLRQRGSLSFSLDRSLLRRGFLQEFGLYSLFTLLSSSMTMRMIRIDNLMILAICGKEAEGIYHTVSFMALLLEIPMKVVKQTSSSRVVNLLEREAYDDLGKLYKEATAWQFALTSCFFLLLYILSDYLLALFSEEVATSMKRLFLTLGISKLVDNLGRMGAEILLLSRYFKWSIVGGVLLLLGIWANHHLIPSMGMYGASLATTITLLLGVVISALWLYYKMGLHPFSWDLLSWMGVMCGSIVLLVVLPKVSTRWIDVLIRAGMVISLYWIRTKRKLGDERDGPRKKGFPLQPS